MACLPCHLAAASRFVMRGRGLTFAARHSALSFKKRRAHGLSQLAAHIVLSGCTPLEWLRRSRTFRQATIVCAAHATFRATFGVRWSRWFCQDYFRSITGNNVAPSFGRDDTCSFSGADVQQVSGLHPRASYAHQRQHEHDVRHLFRASSRAPHLTAVQLQIKERLTWFMLEKSSSHVTCSAAAGHVVDTRDTSER